MQLATPHTCDSLERSINLLSLRFAAGEQLIQNLGWPRYRTSQLFRWLYRKRVRTIDEMTDFSQAARSQLQQLAKIIRFEKVQVLRSSDGTRKFVARLEDDLSIESVLIPDAGRLTLCLSTQVGCTLDCRFCLTATMGLKRNLHAHEIVDQVMTVQDHLEPGERLTSLVLMGMGEPLANFEAVADAIARITNSEWGLGIPARRITLSTAGLASRLRDVAALGINLAISLNATTNAQRDLLMPIANRLHPLNRLLDACRKYPLAPHRRLTFEYVLLDGVNDTEQDAKRLVKLLNGIRCKVNLISFNEFSGNAFRRPDDAMVLQFQKVLRHASLDVFIRKSKGRDVLGACGQLGELPQREPVLLTPAGAHG
ncbi:MAG TPA: 23S rRNA (adenine(2503)-C(2))-methyltransferase RlmN [Nitrospiraceae bacterium]|nr:23S rRNA (adenine(2503)-C(2))-methyltransferase RlmN [Nitrospiraceae bacterium]